MLNFLISTITFSLAVFALNRYFDAQTINGTRSRTMMVMVAATLISIGAGWAVDKLDGDAELHKNDPSMMEIVQSGDPMKIAKLLAGFN
ncbi:MAG: hypothetical protein ACXW1T_13430 [Methylophilus sp.]